MAEWRIGEGWSRAELADRVAAATKLPPNVPEGEVLLDPEHGWNHVLSHAVVAREEPGPPSANGAFAHAKKLVCRFAFSDPRIVVGHWRDNAHLAGRTLLLELKSLGLRFLCPVRIGAVREESGQETTVFGYRFDTLQGHIESGREWFVLSKNHRTGEIIFRIEAGWRAGQFPGLWARAGFHLLGRRYQRAWHRLAHEHLRAAIRDWDAADRRARGHAAPHDGPADAPVQFLAQKALKPARLRVDREAEHMRRDEPWRPIAFGALAGLRSLGPPALLARERQHRERLFRSEPQVAWLARGLAVLALAEAVADKLPWTPSRLQPLSLVARGGSGALAGAAVFPRSRAAGVLLGALSALAAAFLAHRGRRFASQTLRLPDALAGSLEDLLVLSVGSRLASAMP